MPCSWVILYSVSRGSRRAVLHFIWEMVRETSKATAVCRRELMSRGKTSSRGRAGMQQRWRVGPER